jgi:hypothetical protein
MPHLDGATRGAANAHFASGYADTSALDAAMGRNLSAAVAAALA